MLKKTGLCSAYSSWQCCLCSHPLPASTSPLLPPPRHQRKRKRLSSWRSYATVRNSNGTDFRDNMNWPCKANPATKPTPYEIFQLDRGAMYTKHKYYELVKIYHPDRSPLEMCSGITHFERLERYRLVVQAHEILSDPVKRRAYDSHGAGWHEQARVATRHSRGYYSAAADRAYGYGPDDDRSPFGNATWEDWERWYRRADDQDKKQAYGGTYINPNAFASFVVMMAVITGVAQATRAGQYSSTFEEKAAAFTEETNRFLTSRAEHFTENKITSDGRIKHFLEKRDPSRYGLKEEEQKAYREHFGGDRVRPPKARPKTKAHDPPEPPD